MPSRRSILTLTLLVGSQLWAPGNAAAQNAPPAGTQDQPAAAGAAPVPETPIEAGPAPKTKMGEEIVVTGSRIRRKDLTTPAPVAVISKEQIAESGRISIGEFLQTLPEQSNATNTTVNNAGSGATRIDLRGLGTSRTLVLVNGRRMVGGGTGLDTGTGADLNAIPLAVVERIEILKDGASAVYGSDAIAGVVNIITKRSYNGMEANAYQGLSTHGDGWTTDVNVTAGSTGERGSFMFSADYYNQNSVMAMDRPWSRYQLDYDFTTDANGNPTNCTSKASCNNGTVTPIGSSRAPNGRFYKTGTSGAGNADWTALLGAYPKASTFTYDPTAAAIGPSGLHYRPFDASAMAGTPGGGDLYNFQPSNFDVTPSRRIALYSAGEYKLTDSVRAFFESSLVNRNSAYQLAPEPLIIGTGGLDVTVSAQNGYNPFGVDFTQLTRRLTEFGPRFQEQNVDTFRVVTGLNGNIPGIPWTWDASLNYGRTDWTNTNRGNIWKSRLQSAVGPTYTDASGVLQCGTAAAPIPGCVPLNLFGGQGPNGTGTITPAMAQYLSYTGVAGIVNQMTAVQANAAGELPLTLFADRPLGLAVGYEYRFEQGSDTPDPLVAAGESSGNNRQATSGQFHVNEAYAELSIPIANRLPWIENLEATAAARIFDYSTFGTDWTYKFGARYSPVRDMTLRGTYSTAFRAPSITELYLGASDNFPTLKDPCADLTNAPTATKNACIAAGVPPQGNGLVGESQLRTQNGGNPLLQPETAKTWTAGVVVEPRWVKGFSLVVDYYWIEIKKSISTVGAQFILDKCYPTSGNPDPAMCKLVQRDAAGGVTRVEDVNVNVGGTNTAGLDFGLRYNLPTANYGRFAFGFDGTWLQYYNVTQPDGSVINMKGTFDQGVLNGGLGGVYPAFKGLLSAAWGLGGLGAGANLHYIGNIKQCGGQDPTTAGGVCYDNPDGLYRDVGAYWQLDGFVSYAIKSSMGLTSVSVGVNNIFDAAPRTIYGALEPNSDPTAYDFMGRFFYIRLGHKI